MRTLFLYLILLVPFSFLAQRISDFRLLPAGGSVGISFTISKGTSCNGYTIYHSSDSLNFTVLSDNPGTCGRSDADEIKSYTHLYPLINQHNYYRVSLFPVETSKIMGIFVLETNASGITVYPNPLLTADDNLNIRQSGTSQDPLDCEVYSLDGMLLKQVRLPVGIETNAIPLSELKNGLYSIRLSRGTKNFYSKFSILR